MMDFEDDSERDLEGFFDMETGEYVSMAHVDLINTNLHHQILTTAIALASKDWLWRFRDQDYKLRKITGAYRHLNKLIDEAKEG
jgi:hypothetical protein